MGGAVAVGAIVLFFVVVIGGTLVVQSRRIRVQRVAVQDGFLLTVNGIRRAPKRLPVDQIGTVVYLHEHDNRALNGGGGIWTWGGLIILDTHGRVVRHLTHRPGSALPLGSISRQIPAGSHREFDTISRGRFRREFPNSLRFMQLATTVGWAVATLAVVFIGLPVAAVIVTVIVSLVVAATQTG